VNLQLRVPTSRGLDMVSTCYPGKQSDQWSGREVKQKKRLKGEEKGSGECEEKGSRGMQTKDSKGGCKQRGSAPPRVQTNSVNNSSRGSERRLRE
jgi:hypothetical protein